MQWMPTEGQGPEDSCYRCNQGTGEHTCWRIDVQRGVSVYQPINHYHPRHPKPLRVHEAHPDALPGGVRRS